MPHPNPPDPPGLAFLRGGGEMGERMRTFDWASHPLGDPRAWPQSLKSAASTCLGSSLPMLIWWGPELYMLYNDAYRPILGTARHPAALGQAGRECWPEIRHIIGPMLEGTVREGKATWSNDQLLLLDRNGRPEACDYTFTFSPIDESGGVGGVLGEGRGFIEDDVRAEPEPAWPGGTSDVTARRLRDEAFARLAAYSEQQRRLYETILSTTPDLVYVFGLDHRFTYANQALLRMWGKTSDEAIGRNCLELGYEPWHAEMHDREIEQVVATRRPIRGEVPFAGTNGRRIYDYIFVPVFDANGHVEAVAGTTRDVTDRKRAEDALRESEQRLAEANRVKDEFLATLSHELRTPLNAVLGWAHMLRTGTLRPDVQDRALQSLERNAKAQAQLVDDLLDVTRIMSGKLAIKSEALDVTAVIAAAVDAVRPAASAKGIGLGLGVDDGAEIVIEGDADRLQQVVWNLLSNAVKFTPAGGTIDVDLRVDDQHVEIIVRDSGDGIEPAFLPHVFERFRQAESTPSRKHGGLGLGLAIVRHLTEAHGGTVAAASGGVGAGATFVVRLPLDRSRRRPHLAAGKDAGRGSAAALSGVRILVADDDDDARDLTRVVLESRGATVVTVASAEAALDALGRRPFDVLVADIGMPGQDGYALVRAVRGLPPASGRDISAVALTAYATLKEREQALAAGFNAHLGKPIDPEQLSTTVALLMKSGRAGQRGE